jgi:hypothetical protein
MADFEGAEFAGCRTAVDSGATNVARQSFADLVEKCCQFVRSSLYHEFYSTIRQISHKACNVKSAGYLACCVAEAYPLHVAGVKNLAALAGGGSHSTILITSS